MSVQSRAFRIRWDDEPDFEDARAFAAALGRERLISISHSDSHVVVWYWSEQEPALT